jgi:tetratricopeptide (TPR) repeat protein
MDHPYLLRQDQMASVRGRCAELLGRQRAASLFYRDAWRFDPENPNYLSFYLDSLCREGRDEEAWGIVQEELASHPGAPSSVNAMHVINALLVRNRQSGRVVDQQEVDQRRIELLKHFESALGAYESTPPAEWAKMAPWMDYSFMIIFASYEESKDIDKQMETLHRWIERRPDSPYPRVLRGMMTYPGEAANTDFREAIRLGSPDPLPYYFLAHAALRSQDFRECDRLCSLALQRNPEPEIHAALLSWRAISRWNLGRKKSQVRKLFEEAMRLKPDDSLIASYAQEFDDDQSTPRVPSSLQHDGTEHLREQAQQYVSERSRMRIEEISPPLAAATI